MEVNKLIETYIKQGRTVFVTIRNFYGFDQKQQNFLRESGCEWDNIKSWHFVAKSLRKYHSMCKTLKDYEQGSFSLDC